MQSVFHIALNANKFISIFFSSMCWPQRYKASKHQSIKVSRYQSIKAQKSPVTWHSEGAYMEG
ncbi:MAG: hypothetical protein ACI93R_000753 [Flavobacteriales bacterium]|jgi:hypothetical protein